MKNFLSSFLTLVVFFSTANLAIAQDDAESVHKKLSDQFRSAHSLKVSATSASGNIEIKLSAKRGNKFVIEMAGRHIVSNGSIVWNYVPSKKTVTVSKYNARSGGLSLEQLLLDAIASYKPVSLKTENNSQNGSSFVLRLEPSTQELQGTKSITLHVTRNSYVVKQVNFVTDQGAQNWSINSLKTNIDLPDSAFEFKAPAGTEVIDLTE